MTSIVQKHAVYAMGRLKVWFQLKVRIGKGNILNEKRNIYALQFNCFISCKHHIVGLGFLIECLVNPQKWHV